MKVTQSKASAPEKSEAVEKKTAVVKVRVKAPTTFMVHALTGQPFDGAGVELETVDSWTQSQVDAGKLEVVEE